MRDQSADDDFNRAHKLFRLHTLNHSRVSGSRLLSPVGSVAVRSVLFTYTLTVWIFTIVSDARHGKMSGHFAYFTNLCYTGLLAYFASSLFHTVQFWRRGTASSFTSMPRILQLMHWLLFSSALVYAIVVTVIFWGVLFKSSEYKSSASLWSTASVHALNTVFMVVDMFVGAMVLSPHWTHPTVLSFIGLLYVMLAYLNEAINGWFTYSFLNYKKLKAVEFPVILGILAGFLVAYYVLYGIHQLVDRVLPLKGYEHKPAGDIEYNALDTISSKSSSE
ncbi:hypothetical protein GQ54DRAFT_275616 [Martensiomyces pterosporus]|nr:hypothetical protein GQ54DRAFT_275616 [Martensiomyces pterosporus]